MKYAAICISLLALGSCRFYGYARTIQAIIPPPPQHWLAGILLTKVEIRYLGIDGSVDAIYLDADVRCVELQIPKLPVVAVTARLCASEPALDLYPAGAVYPWHLIDGDRLELTWINGFVSTVLLSCPPDRAQAVNVQRLCDYVVEKSANDPWKIDAVEVQRAVERGTLNSRSIKTLPAFDVHVPAGPGRWVSGNPNVSLEMSADGGYLDIPGLPAGVHSFFNVESGARIGVSVGPGGWVCVDPTLEAGSDGRW